MQRVSLGSTTLLRLRGRSDMSAEGVQVNTTEKSKEDIFANLFKTGGIREIGRNDIPETVRNHFEGMSSRFISPSDYRKENFNSYYVIEHTDIPDLKTYVAEQDKYYGNIGEQKGLERNVYFYDMLGEVEVGHGELRYQPESDEEYFKDRPFVGFNQTEKEFRKRNFAFKRLIEMGSYSVMQWGLPLYSGDQNADADKVWQKLMREGMAEEVPTDNPIRKRYRLVL
ncbi:MAG: hypothetical protein G01um101491_292 [Parcubacteria group bacterium Gr01-1014_91]|nr:MAG: hypothetical protein G01um101491_292 [Parcubacteria group bacterium Gr01-1014_91]